MAAQLSAIDEASIAVFQQYLRINTVQPDPDYDSAVDFLQKEAESIGLQFQSVEVHPGNPVVVLTLTGQEPDLPSIFLNSHIDVVPVFSEHWKYPPFSAYRDVNGDIYARGAQDMKCVGIQYLEAVRRLKLAGTTFKRTIHLVYVPDEEIGGELGMKLFVHTPLFKSLNVGFCLDEGLASENGVYSVFNAERNCWWLEVTVRGNPGHGSRFIENTAMEKAYKIIGKFFEFRAEQKKLLESTPEFSLGDVTTVNLNKIIGGVQVNVLPAEVVLTFDIRIPPTADIEEFERTVDNWIVSSGTDISYEYLHQNKIRHITEASDKNIWWKTFVDSMESQNLEYKRMHFLGSTDSRYLRELDIPVLLFSPMINTPILLHDHNEFLNDKVFVKGIEIYKNLIPALANV